MHFVKEPNIYTCNWSSFELMTCNNPTVSNISMSYYAVILTSLKGRNIIVYYRIWFYCASLNQILLHKPFLSQDRRSCPLSNPQHTTRNRNCHFEGSFCRQWHQGSHFQTSQPEKPENQSETFPSGIRDSVFHSRTRQQLEPGPFD